MFLCVCMCLCLCLYVCVHAYISVCMHVQIKSALTSLIVSVPLCRQRMLDISGSWEEAPGCLN